MLEQRSSPWPDQAAASHACFALHQLMHGGHEAPQHAMRESLPAQMLLSQAHFRVMSTSLSSPQHSSFQGQRFAHSAGSRVQLLLPPRQRVQHAQLLALSTSRRERLPQQRAQRAWQPSFLPRHEASLRASPASPPLSLVDLRVQQRALTYTCSAQSQLHRVLH